MEMQATVTIRGAKLFKGTLDNGNAIDSGKVFIDNDLKGENSFGVCTFETKCTNSKIVEGIKHLPFPFIADVSITVESNGKVQSQVITAIKPRAQEKK